MTLAEQIAQYVSRLPGALRPLLEAELAAGNEIINVDVGRAEDQGKVALILRRPFKNQFKPPPPGVLYREKRTKDRTVFQYANAGERFALAHVQFKPMELPKLRRGPLDPAAEHIAGMEQQAVEKEKTASAEAASRPEDPKLGEAANRFLASMPITYEMWHDGSGYDLDALRQVPPSERDAVEQVVLGRHPPDWRDIEALAVIDSSRARQAIEAALKSHDPSVRREAMRYAGDKVDPQERQERLLKLLKTCAPFGGLTEALDEIGEFHPPTVIDALLRGTLERDGAAAMHFAAMLFFLHGKAAEPFDWAQRPFFLRFNSDNRAERKAAFKELCQIIGVNSAAYLP